MAVTILRDDREDGGGDVVRLHVGSLHSLLVLIDDERGLPEPARRVVRRWLADIDADLGYVALDRSLLAAPGTLDALRDAVGLAVADLTGAGLPPMLAARTQDPDALRAMMLRQARLLDAWLAAR